MAITVVGVGAQVNRNSTGTLTVPWPSAYSPIAGDVAVVFEYNTILGTTRPAVVSGYTVVDEVFTGSSVNRQTRVLYRVSTAASWSRKSRQFRQLCVWCCTRDLSRSQPRNTSRCNTNQGRANIVLHHLHPSNDYHSDRWRNGGVCCPILTTMLSLYLRRSHSLC
jgi:hypothetical protein